MKKQSILKAAAGLILILVAAAFVPQVVEFVSHLGSAGAAAMAAAPLVTIFTKDIEEKLYPENEFYQHAVDDSVWIKGNKVVRGVAGVSPGVTTNPTVFPLTANQRADDSNEYTISQHVTDPVILTRDEELIVNYNKRQSILNDHINTLNTRIADNFAYTWAPTAAGLIIPTSGAAVAAGASAQTGQRKAITKEDFVAAFTLLVKQNAKGQKYAVVPAEMYSQLLLIPDFVDYTKTGRADILKTGLIGEIVSIKIYLRSYTTLYTNAGVKKPITTAGAASDNQSILVWDETSVYKALGKVNVNIENRPATYLGDILNADVRSGGNTRKDGTGAVSITQSATA